MKPLSYKTLFPILILFSVSLSAQITSNPSAIHGSYKKGDTISEYDDEPQKHLHEQVTIIKEKKLTPAEAEKAGVKVPPYMQHKGSQSTTAAADTSPVQDTASQTATVSQDSQNARQTSAGLIVTNLIGPSGCDCIGINFIYAAFLLIGLGLLFDLYLLFQTLRDQKRSALASVLHALLATAGMTLFVTYCIFQAAPIIALGCLVIAVLLGLILLYNDIAGNPSSKGLAIIQAAIALVGVVLLAIFACIH